MQVFATESAVFQLPIGSKLTITTDGTAVVQRIFNFSKVEDVALVSGDVFGPYSAPMQINVLGLTGTTTVAEAVATAELSDIGFANPMTTAGDLIKGGASGVASRLAKGTDGQVLTMVAGAIAWADPV